MIIKSKSVQERSTQLWNDVVDC